MRCLQENWTPGWPVAVEFQPRACPLYCSHQRTWQCLRIFPWEEVAFHLVLSNRIESKVSSSWPLWPSFCKVWSFFQSYEEFPWAKNIKVTSSFPIVADVSSPFSGPNSLKLCCVIKFFLVKVRQKSQCFIIEMTVSCVPYNLLNANGRQLCPIRLWRFTHFQTLTSLWIFRSSGHQRENSRKIAYSREVRILKTTT